MKSSFWFKGAAVGSLFLLPALAYAATAGFSSPSFSVKEGETAAIKVKLNGATSRETTVRVLVYPGTAWRGSYAPSGTQKLSFPAGSTEQSFDIKTFKTGRAKNQTVGLRLISVSGTGNSVNRSLNTGVLVIKKGDVATTTPPGGGTTPPGGGTPPSPPPAGFTVLDKGSFPNTSLTPYTKDKIDVAMGNRTIAVLKFKTPSERTTFRFETVNDWNGPLPDLYEISVSEFRGSIPQGKCRWQTSSINGSGPIYSQTEEHPYYCTIKPNTIYYFQIRWVTPQGASTCNPPYIPVETPGDGCHVRVKLNCNYAASGLACELPEPVATPSVPDTIVCPTNGIQVRTFRGVGNTDQLRLHSNEIAVYALPRSTSFGGGGNGVPSIGGSVTLGETPGSPRANPSFEITISRCPGDMSYWSSQPRTVPGNTTTYFPCRFTTTNPNYMGVGVRFSGSSDANHCDTPDTRAPWYVNIRYRYGAGACPLAGDWCYQSIQWNIGA